MTLALTFWAGAAAAQTPDPGCTSTTSGVARLFVGITTETVEIICPSSDGVIAPSTAYAVRVDLGAPDLSFEASSLGEGGAFNMELTTAFLQRTNSQVAFNANLFTNCCSDTTGGPSLLRGLEINGGQVLSPLKNNPPPDPPPYPFDTSLTVAGNAVRIATLDRVDPAINTAVTGSHMLVLSGQNVAPLDTEPVEFFGPNARTLVGLSADNNVLWIVAVERKATRGVTLPQAAQLMMQLGAATALNLDGGGSTSLAVDEGFGKVRLLNTPNDHATGCTFPKGDKCERYVGASFGIHAQSLP